MSAFGVPARTPERELFRGYSRPVLRVVSSKPRREDCACGQVLEIVMPADRDEAEAAVLELVLTHNATPRHAAWSAETRLLP